MKFLALVKKEVRECIPWVILAGIVYVAAGSLLLSRMDYPNLGEQAFLWLGTLLVITSSGLGLILGLRQFLVAEFDKTWTLTLNRPIPRHMIVTAKLVAASLGLVVSVGLPWTV